MWTAIGISVLGHWFIGKHLSNDLDIGLSNEHYYFRLILISFLIINRYTHTEREKESSLWILCQNSMIFFFRSFNFFFYLSLSLINDKFSERLGSSLKLFFNTRFPRRNQRTELFRRKRPRGTNDGVVCVCKCMDVGARAQLMFSVTGKAELAWETPFMVAWSVNFSLSLYLIALVILVLVMVMVMVVVFGGRASSDT